MALKSRRAQELDDRIRYPADDGIPMDDTKGELNAAMLRESLQAELERRGTSAFAVVNNFIYYRVDTRTKSVGPDFYVVLDTPFDEERDCWRTWNEDGRLPHVIVEFVSKSSEKKDRVTNLEIYRDYLRTPNYFICNNRRYLLDGFHLQDGMYVPLEPDQSGRMWCDELRLSVSFHDGFLRWFDAEGHMLLTGKEQARKERQHAEQERARADRLAARLRELGIEDDV